VLLFYRLCRAPGARQRRLIDGAFIVLALGAAWFAWFAQIDWWTRRPLAQEVFVVALFAELLVVLRPLNESFKHLWLGRALMSLGAISYSLYLIHQCNIRFVSSVAGLVLPAGWTWQSMTFQVCLHVLLAIPFYFLCERPFHNKSLSGENGTANQPAAPVLVGQSVAPSLSEAAF